MSMPSLCTEEPHPFIDLDMGKYIDANRLCAEIEKTYKSEIQPWLSGVSATSAIYDYVLPLIDSLQQEQPESSKSKFMFPKFLYARTVDNKTIDISYAPQSMDAVEYIKNDPTEQPEVDLEKEIRSMWEKCNPTDEGMGVESTYMHIEAFDIIARHFAEWGYLRAAEKYDEIEYNRQMAEEHLADARKTSPKDLEEAAEESWQNSPDKGIYDEYSPFYKDGFIAGAKWQKEQMMKEAVEMEAGLLTKHLPMLLVTNQWK